jgi:pyrroloquinoline quinone biosynthesis protein D
MTPLQDSDRIPDGGRASALSKEKPTRPVRVSGAHEYRLGDELLVYVPNSETAHALNRSAVAIWEMCDGTRTPEEISRALGQWLGRPGEALLPDTRWGIAQLCELGLLEAES